MEETNITKHDFPGSNIAWQNNRHSADRFAIFAQHKASLCQLQILPISTHYRHCMHCLQHCVHSAARFPC